MASPRGIESLFRQWFRRSAGGIKATAKSTLTLAALNRLGRSGLTPDTRADAPTAGSFHARQLYSRPRLAEPGSPRLKRQRQRLAIGPELLYSVAPC